MKCVVSRTSIRDEEAKRRPCKEAKKEILTDKRTLESIELWTIELENLQALIDFSVEEDFELVILSSGCEEIPTEIEIYDGNRE